MSNEPTPRTDAFISKSNDLCSWAQLCDYARNFARTLERELAQCQKEREELIRAFDKAGKNIGVIQDWMATPREDVLANAIQKLQSDLTQARREAEEAKSQRDLLASASDKIRLSMGEEITSYVATQREFIVERDSLRAQLSERLAHHKECIDNNVARENELRAQLDTANRDAAAMKEAVTRIRYFFVFHNSEQPLPEDWPKHANGLPYTCRDLAESALSTN